MRVAVIGSRNVVIKDIHTFIPKECDEIVSGGAKGVDTCAADYAGKNGKKLKVFLPEYDKYGRTAPLVRNQQIVDYSDGVIAFWDGKSKGTLFTVRYAEKVGKPVKLILIENNQE